MLIRKATVIFPNGIEKKNMDVGISDGIFAHLDNHDPLLSTAGYKRIINGENFVIAPGFINAHTHVPMTLMRGYGDEMNLNKWLFDRIFPFEDKLKSEDVYWGSMLGIAEMISTGTTSFSDMYCFCDQIARAVDESGIKANIGRGLSIFDENVKFSDTAAYGETQELIKEYKKHPRIKIDIAPHSEYTTRPDVLEDIAEFAKDNNINIQIHISETLNEHNDCIKRHGMTPTRVADKTGVLGKNTTIAHGVWLTNSDMDIIAERESVLAHCPQSNLKLGSGIARIEAARQAGVLLALGTDSAASNNNLDMLQEMKSAALIAKGIGHDPKVFPSHEIFMIASYGGALAQRRLDTGRIEVGAKADFVVFDKGRISMIPAHSNLSNIVYAAGCADIYMTVVNGNVLYKNGEFKTIDIERVKFMAQRKTSEILKRL